MYFIVDTGICCEGDRCNHPEGKLRPTHKCPKCECIAHRQCGVFDKTLDHIVYNTWAKVNTVHDGSD